MKTVLVCLLAVLAVSATQAPKPFKSQQSYIYRFDSQVSSSLLGSTPAEIQQQASTRLRADVHISFSSDRRLKLQLKSVRLGESNGEMPKSQRVQPLEHFERREIPQELKRELELPLAADYVDGVIEKINFDDREDSQWSKNIKRAVLNMIQLNLKRNDAQNLKMVSSMPEEEKDKNAPVFQIPEITLEGECETVYTIQKSPKYEQEGEQSIFNVTKTINFNKCQRTSDVSYGYQANPSQELRCLNCIRQQKPLPNAEQTEKIRYTHCQEECQPNTVNEDNDLERSTFARYELIGKPDNKYAIKRAQILSQYIVKGQNPASQNAITQVVSLAELTFKEQSQDSNLVASFKESETKETLLYSPEWDLKEKRFYMAGDSEFEKNSPFKKVQKKEQKVSHVLRTIMKQWSKKEMGYELDTAVLFNQLVEQIRQATVKEIMSMKDIVRAGAQQSGEEGWCHNDDEKTCEERARTIFLDALAVAATRNSLHVLADKIMKDEISQAKAVAVLQMFVANQHSPSEQQVDILERIAKHEVSHRHSALKQTAWLSFGTAVGAICQDKPSQGQKELFRVEEICPRGKKEQYKQTLTQFLKDADTPYEQVLALKAIGNAALDNMMQELEQIIREKRQPVVVRMEAIDALRRLRTGMPQKIRQILLPIFQNTRETPEVRMAAASMIFYTHPEPSMLDQMAFAVIQDRSQNVKCFVLTAMEALAQSPSSAEQQVAAHMKSALKLVQVEPEEMRASRLYRVPIYVSDKEFTEEQNIFLGMASIVSPSNMIPIHLSASLRTALNGEATEETLKLSFTQKNLEQWYEKISDYAQDYLDSDEEEREDKERKSAKDLRGIYTSLGIKSRRTGSYYLSEEDESDETQTEKTGRSFNKIGSHKPFGMIVLRANDVDAAIIPISEDQLPHIVRKIIKKEKPNMNDLEDMTRHLSSGQHFQKTGAMSLAEKKTKIPTTSGLPLALIRQWTAVATLEGKVKVDYESANLESSRGMNAHLKIRLSALGTHLHKTEVWSPVVITGVKTLRTVELNGPLEIKLRASKQQVEIKVLPPHEHRVRIFGVHTLPMTYTQQFDMDTQTKREPRVRSVHNYALEHTQREYHAHEQTENSFQVEGHYHRLTTPQQFLQGLYTTENNVHFYYNPSQNPLKELTIRISGSMFQKHKEHSRPEMENFYSSNKGFKHIYEEDAEQMDLEQDEERQNKLSSWNQKYSSDDAYKHQIRIEAEARFPEHTRKMETDLSGACDARLKHCKFFVDAKRSPIRSWGENQEWQMKAKIQTVAPEIIRDEEDISQKQSRALVQTSVEWGSDNKNEIKLRLQAEPTKKTMWRSQSSDKWSRILNKIDLVAEYQLHSKQKHMIQRLYELLKAKLFWQLRTEERRGEEGLVRATIVIDPITRRYANITMQTPQERLRAEGVEMPARILSGYRLERRPSNVRSMSTLMNTFSSHGSDACKVDERRVNTFDGVHYRAPLSSCWSVLAKDCSREEPRFVVLMKKDQGQKKVKIITPESTIELSRSSENEKLKVKIDGEHVKDEERLSEEDIELTHNKVYVTKRGVSVEFDGEEAKIKVASQYKNIQCGLCGHYNEEDSDVFRMSNNKRSNNLPEFHRSYTLKNEECDEKQLDKHYKDSDEFFVRPQRRHQRQGGNRRSDLFDDSEEDSQERRRNNDWETSSEKTDGKNIKSVDRTEVIEYNNKVCFSSEPVKKCPRGTTPDDEESTNPVKVQFFCMNRSTSEARRLQRQVREGRQVDNEGRSPAFVETVNQPKKCVAY